VLLSECTNPLEKTIVQAPVASAADKVAHDGVETHLRTALRSEPSLAGLDITAITTKGDARLTAVVQSQAQVDTALRIARAAGGKRHSRDLTVKQ